MLKFRFVTSSRAQTSFTPSETAHEKKSNNNTYLNYNTNKTNDLITFHSRSKTLRPFNIVQLKFSAKSISIVESSTFGRLPERNAFSPRFHVQFLLLHQLSHGLRTCTQSSLFIFFNTLIRKSTVELSFCPH